MMRLQRIYPGAQYRPLTRTLTIPAPFAGSLGSGPMPGDQVIAWTNQLLDDLPLGSLTALVGAPYFLLALRHAEDR